MLQMLAGPLGLLSPWLRDGELADVVFQVAATFPMKRPAVGAPNKGSRLMCRDSSSKSRNKTTSNRSSEAAGEEFRCLAYSHRNPKQILTCSSTLVNVAPESTPMAGYLRNVFSRVVT